MTAATTATPTSIRKRFIVPPVDPPPHARECADSTTPSGSCQWCAPTEASPSLGSMLREELRRLITWSERHRRLLARVLIAFGLSAVVDVVCATLMWSFESGLKGSDLHGFGD